MKTITFHSYKGGSCRTTTMFNTIPFLVEKNNITSNNPLIIFDMDYKSAGITILLDLKDVYYSKNAENSLEKGKKHSIQYLLGKGKNIRGCDDFDEFKDNYGTFVGNKFGLDDNESVICVGANLSSEAPDLTNGQKEDSGIDEIKSALDTFMSDFSSDVSYLVLDAPAGRQNAALASMDKSNNVVCCLRPSYQFRETTFKDLNDVLVEQYKSRKRIVIVPTAVSAYEVRIDGKLQLRVAINDIDSKMKCIKTADFEYAMLNPDNFKDVECGIEEYKEVYGINAVTRFLWNEKSTLYGIYKGIDLKKAIENPENVNVENKANVVREEIAAYNRYKFLATLL